MVKLIHTLADHGDDVNCCAFSFSLLATCSLDKTVRLYSLSDFTELPHSPLKFHTYAVHCCCFSPSGHILASCSTDGTTVLWKTENGQTLAVMEQPSGSPVRVCQFSPDSTCLASGAADGTVVLWNAQSYKLYRCGSVKDGSLVACAFSPNGSFFVTGSSCGDLTVWDDKMRCLHSEKAHDLGITCCNFSSQPVSDSKIDFAGDKCLAFVQHTKGEIGEGLEVDTEWHPKIIEYISEMHSDPHLWLFVAAFIPIKIWVTTLGRCTDFCLPNPVLIEITNDNPAYQVMSWFELPLVNFSPSEDTYWLFLLTRYVTTCAFAPHTLLLATGSMDKTVNIWHFDLETLCQARSTEDHLKQFTEDWSEEDVSTWLCAQGLKDLVGIFKMNNIDGKELLTLTKESLADDLKIGRLDKLKVLRKIEELRTRVKSLSSEIPDEFICPITRELMKDPVIASAELNQFLSIYIGRFSTIGNHTDVYQYIYTVEYCGENKYTKVQNGYSYEKEAMENWISTKKRTSPMTNLVLPSVILTPNRTLKMAIDRWLETHQK
ncbi:WD repeat, SAM and U-box domain-containing protein 1 [Saguinus oedipus]|uniref:WD repeat, SAM and U-box domain-containing protein 1 n=1 Tax=Saguinus oedipus TaxID=9490 RepID=A0ABQ9VHS2_SAGOE|nr:WD repeat, SAM and U-box domain-containing protein 1 [Saguinus oedipus]